MRCKYIKFIRQINCLLYLTENDCPSPYLYSGAKNVKDLIIIYFDRAFTVRI